MADLFGFEPQRRNRHGTTTALVAVDSERSCPMCAAPVVARPMWEGTLFRHAGHGATRRTVRRECSACRWSMVAEVTEIHPAKD